jgi:hypothetical protein
VREDFWVSKGLAARPTHALRFAGFHDHEMGTRPKIFQVTLAGPGGGGAPGKAKLPESCLARAQYWLQIGNEKLWINP